MTHWLRPYAPMMEPPKLQWTEFVREATPFFQAIGDRLIVDMLD